MQVRHVALHDALARATPEQAARRDRLGGHVDLMGVGPVGGEEAVDAAGDVAERQIEAHRPYPGRGEQAEDPAQRHPGHEEGGSEGDGDQDGLADVGLDQQQGHGDGQLM